MPLQTNTYICFLPGCGIGDSTAAGPKCGILLGDVSILFLPNRGNVPEVSLGLARLNCGIPLEVSSEVFLPYCGVGLKGLELFSRLKLGIGANGGVSPFSLLTRSPCNDFVLLPVLYPESTVYENYKLVIHY